MTSDYIRRIKANVSIYASHKTSCILDGTYASVFMGRSMNFEDLREYVPGDSIRDIDWKASSRSGNLFVKRYIAEKKHNILIIPDTGVKMQGETRLGRDKKEIALYTMGTIAYLAYKNGDNVGTVYNRDGQIQFHNFKTGLVNAEKILSFYNKDMFEGKSNSLDKVFTFVLNNLRRRMIIFVITDLEGGHSVNETLLRQLKCMHDVLFVNIGDASLTDVKARKSKNDLEAGQGSEMLTKRKRIFSKAELKQEKKKHAKGVFDLVGNHYMPMFISGNKKLARLEQEYISQLTSERDAKLSKYGISSVGINEEDEIVTKIIELLEKHKIVNIR